MGKSDHDPLKIKTNILKKKFFDKESIKYNLEKGNFIALKNYLTDIYWMTTFGDLNSGTVWDMIENKLGEGIKSFIPLKKLNSKRNKSHLTGEVEKSVKKKYLLYKIRINSENSHDYQNYIKEQHLTAKLIKKAKREHEENP